MELFRSVLIVIILTISTGQLTIGQSLNEESPPLNEVPLDERPSNKSVKSLIPEVATKPDILATSATTTAISTTVVQTATTVATTEEETTPRIDETTTKQPTTIERLIASTIGFTDTTRTSSATAEAQTIEAITPTTQIHTTSVDTVETTYAPTQVITSTRREERTTGAERMTVSTTSNATEMNVLSSRANVENTTHLFDTTTQASTTQHTPTTMSNKKQASTVEIGQSTNLATTKATTTEKALIAAAIPDQDPTYTTAQNKTDTTDENVNVGATTDDEVEEVDEKESGRSYAWVSAIVLFIFFCV